ncbi:SLC13 family permease [Moorella naiadis]|uniref:SLC13 family permease n=1 Tax=Moorella naiadis (nom. illeg.) TaxID=3093670 RepID=UPI003D9CA8AD
MEGLVPVISLIAMIIAIIISVTTSLNIGTLAMGLSLVVGYYIGGEKIDAILKGYPTSLFIMLAGVTYLFAIAQVNGTLEKITKYAVKAVRGNVALLPIVFFFVAFGLSAMGPGQITISALMAAPAMLLAEEVGISPLLMALVVGNSAQAGAMSPIAPPGIITAGLTQKMGLTGVSGVLWLNMFIGHAAVAIIAYLLFGGLKLLRAQDSGQRQTLANLQVESFTQSQIITLIGVAVLIIGALFFKLDIGFGAFLIGAILSLLKVVDEGKAIKAMPWGTIVMVTGVTVLVQLMSKVGGMDLFASIIAKFSTPLTVTLVAGFIAGLISAYASTTGVILPAFIPLAPVLLQKLGSTDLMPLLSAIVVCGFLTDLSPLSTTGAVFLANAGEKTDKTKLFRDMLIWGLSMSVVGAVISWLAFSILRLP